VRISLLGTRGPGHYGGFETCVAEIAPRLAARGHDVTVYARRWSPAAEWRSPGVDVVSLPSVPRKNLDTITHSFLCTLHALVRRPDAVLVFGVGNSMWAWVLRLFGIGVVLNVDGLDRERRKWGWFARAFLTWSERLSPRAAQVVVTDARHILDYYCERYDRKTTFITYGAPDGPVDGDRIVRLVGLEADRYVLYVSRLEPENNAHVLIEAYRRSGLEVPLAIVGDSAYDTEYSRRVKREADERIRVLGFVFGDGYRELQSHAGIYVQCTEVGGTHPALVEAMGFGNAVIALDTLEHREVLGDAGRYYRTTDELADELRRVWADKALRVSLAEAALRRARDLYSWDAVALAYEEASREALGHEESPREALT
jgi:glycosyltransferase involved in cell wall biosynthesis